MQRVLPEELLGGHTHVRPDNSLVGATWLPEALLSSFGFVEVWQIIRSVSSYDALFYLLYPENYRMTTSVEMAGVLSLATPFNIFIVSCAVLTLASFAVFNFKVIYARSKSGSGGGRMGGWSGGGGGFPRGGPSGAVGGAVGGGGFRGGR